MVTKAQHYIWRGYLKRWNKGKSSKGEIYIYRKHPRGSQPQIEFTKLEKVGFEKYYYDMTGFSQEDTSFMTQFIGYMERNVPFKMSLNPDLFPEANVKRDFVESVMCSYEDIDNTNGFLSRIVKGDLSFYQDTISQITLNKLSEEMLARIFGVHQTSDEELSVAFINAMKHIDDEDYKYEFLKFFFMQYMRSPTRMDAQFKAFDEIKRRYPEKVGNMHANFYANSVMIFLTEKLALNVSHDFHSWIERIENQTDTPFLTSDTPVINLTGTKFLDKCEFYYPLSPSVAMKLCLAYKDGIYKHATNQNIEIKNPEDVKVYNQVIVEQCKNEIFADRRSILEEMMSKQNY